MAFDFRKLPRCGAKARSNQHQPCRQAAMPNGKCHWHGGSVLIKHGRCTKESHSQRVECRYLINDLRKSLLSLEGFIYVG
jgi:hypothetical protein